MALISRDLSKAIELLTAGELVAIPTETVYGLAGNIYNEKAIRKIFETKKRPLYNPLIVHVHSVDQLENLVEDFPEKAKLLAEKFWPGSLTLLLKKKDAVPNLITAGKETVAVRIPNHPVTLQLLAALPFPLAAPSANPFNRISPTKAEHVANYFPDSLALVLEGGQCTNGIESTIIGFEEGEAIVYRLGAISLEEIKAVIGEVSIKNKSEDAPNAPGMLAKHYAPNTKLILVDNLEEAIEKHKEKKIALLRYTEKSTNISYAHEVILSSNGDLKEAAANLYLALHELDDLAVDLIIAEKFPMTGLGKSINDRLERAAKNE